MLLGALQQIIDRVARARLPAIFGPRECAAAGGLIAYGPDQKRANRAAADYVDKILRGASPASLPVEQPTKIELIINLNTARELVTRSGHRRSELSASSENGYFLTNAGIIDTPMSTQAAAVVAERTGLDSDNVQKRLIANHPIGRLGRDFDVANAIKFLASDAAAFMTGSELVVDGGWTAT